MAFAAVCSVAQILDQSLQHQHFIFRNREEVESLFNEVTSLRAILQNSNSHKNSQYIASLEAQMVNAAYRARDLIETHIGEQIILVNKLIFSAQEWFNEAKVEIDFIAQGLMEIDREVVENEKPIICSPEVDLDPYDIGMLQIVLPCVRKTTFIVGMAGIGKTTLARKVFNSIAYQFQNRAWVTVSQSYDVKQILIDLLHSFRNCPEDMHEKNTQQLQEYMYRSLEGTTYLIVLDDLRDIQILDLLTQILPKDGETKGKILATTRFENVVVSTKSSHIHRMTIYRHIMHHQYLIQSSRKKAESLLKKVSLLNGIILENSSGKSTKERKSLETKIINAEKRVKAFIESCVMEYKLTFSPKCLIEVKGETDLIRKLVIKIDENEESRHLHCFRGAARVGNIITEDFKEIKNKLAEESSKLEIVSLVGMGGIGKTTLARQVYEDNFFLECFPICAWVTVSQSFDLQNVLISLLDSMKKENIKVDEKSNIGDLSERLYKKLKGWRYLIIIDDVWDTKVWDDLRRIFPDDKCSSRILLTTRLEDVAVHANSYLHHVHFLNEYESWNLFCRKVFGEDSCPPQLEETGKPIVQHCRGLPLSIVVIGGLLSRVTRTQDYWKIVCQNISSSMLSNGDDHCLQILSLSYTHLSDHMKKCFLYTGIYSEDSDILVSRLVKLWIAEGFIEPMSSNRLMEDIAYETLLDLVGRSLLLVDEQSSTGKIKTCKIHALVRDFCTKEAKSKMFFHITDTSLYGIPVDAKIPLCLSIHLNKRNIIPCDIKKLSSLEVSSLHIFDPTFYYLVHHLNREPLRVLDMGKSDSWIRCTQWEPNEFLSHNLRYLSFNPLGSVDKLSIPSSSMLPKLQTLILHGSHRTYELPSIWNMAQVRHVKMSRLCLSDPLEGENSAIVLENLQTLSQVYNFKLSKDVLGRIPNLKKLKIIYRFMKKSDWQHYCLENLMCLQKLEALTCTLVGPCPPRLHILTFPPSLKKLTLQECGLPWKDMKIVGSLPNLEVLKLRSGSFSGKEWEWESTEEEFAKLKFFMLEHLLLELWTANRVNFPGLQCLIIRNCTDLVEIPRCIGEIPTLQLIELRGCCDSLRDLVKEMQDEQLEYGNDGLEARIIHR